MDNCSLNCLSIFVVIDSLFSCNYYSSNYKNNKVTVYGAIRELRVRAWINCRVRVYGLCQNIDWTAKKVQTKKAYKDDFYFHGFSNYSKLAFV